MINRDKFLTPEESMEVEKALLTSEEKFLTRLTISSFKMLNLIAQDLGMKIDDLTTPQIINWMEKDSKVRREQGAENANLKW